MDLLRGQVQRGVAADLLAVPGLAVGHRAGRQGGAGPWHVFVAEEHPQARESLDHRLGDRRPRRFAQRLLFGGRDPRRQVLERRIQRRCSRVLQVGDRGDRTFASLQHRARHAETARQAVAHVRHLLVEVARDVVEACDVGAIRGGGMHRPAGHEVQVGPERAVRVERHLVAAQADVVGQVLDLGTVDRQVDPVGFRQLCGVQCIELAQHVAPDVQTRLLRRGRNVRQARIEVAFLGDAVLVAQAVLRLAPGPFLAVDRLEAGVDLVGGGCDGRPGMRRDRCGQGQGEQEGDGQGTDHGRSGQAGDPDDPIPLHPDPWPESREGP